MGQCGPALAELYDLLVQQNSLTDNWRRAAEAGERALALWQQIGDKGREGATMARLSRTMSRMGRPGMWQYAEDAVATLEPLGPSRELAFAYNMMAKGAWAEGRCERGIGLARRAQALATELAIPDVLSDAMNTEACFTSGGGGDWQSLMQRALEVAIVADAQDQAGHAYANMCQLLLAERSFVECEKYLDEGAQYCHAHDLATYGLFLRVGRVYLTLLQGRWEETVALARPILDGHMSSPVNRAILAILMGLVLARRGETEAWTHLDEALSTAIASGEDGLLLLSYPAHAEAHWLVGDFAAGCADLAAARCALAANPAMAGRLTAWCWRLGMDVPDVTIAEHDPARTGAGRRFRRCRERLGRTWHAVRGRARAL